MILNQQNEEVGEEQKKIVYAMALNAFRLNCVYLYYAELSKNQMSESKTEKIWNEMKRKPKKKKENIYSICIMIGRINMLSFVQL